MASRFGEASGRLIAATGAGLSFREACRREGIPEATGRSWLQRGRREPDGPFGAFEAAVGAARVLSDESDELLSEQELLAAASAAARRGSVQAMRLVWEMLRANPAGRRPDDLAEVDEIAARRQAAARRAPSSA